MTAAGIKPWALVHGASWLAEEGRVMPVPGFHEDWIRSHGELVDGATNVCEVVLRKGWLSVTVFDEGYVEILVPDRADPAIVSKLERLLAANPGAWSKALVMSMDQEGYALYRPEDLGPDGHFLSPARTISA